jgi:hypothetical protein
MAIRRSISIMLALALVGTASCAKIFPATKHDGPNVTSLKPRVEKTAARRRQGSDVTMPESADPRRLIGALVPCDPADSAAINPRIVTDCQHVDQKGDIMRPQVDTTTRRTP